MHSLEHSVQSLFTYLLRLFLGGFKSKEWLKKKKKVVKHLPGNAGDANSIIGLGRSPGEGNNNLLIVLPGKSHGQRSLVGYSPWGHKRVGHHLATKQQQYTC